jgi:hypothetical protein
MVIIIRDQLLSLSGGREGGRETDRERTGTSIKARKGWRMQNIFRNRNTNHRLWREP